MADSVDRAISIRDAIVTVIDEEVSEGRFVTSIDYIDSYRLENIKGVRVNVKIVGFETEAIDRAPSSEDRCRYEISIQQACSKDDTKKLDSLTRIYKRINKKFYPLSELTAFANHVVCIDVESEPYNEVCLEYHKHFHSRIVLTYREWVSD